MPVRPDGSWRWVDGILHGVYHGCDPWERFLLMMVSSDVLTDMVIMMRAPILVVMFVLGSCIGSFCGVIAWRVPRGMTITRPARSFCGSCHHMIRWYDDIPIISWLFLRGRCRDCHDRIPFFYPFMELVYGAMFLACTWSAYAGVIGGWYLPALLFAGTMMLTMAVIDQQTHYVYDVMIDAMGLGTVALLALCALLSGGEWAALLHAVIGGAVIFGFYLLAALWFRYVRHIEGVGAGDVGVALTVGMILGYYGWGRLIVGFFAIFLIEAIVVLVMIVYGLITKHGMGMFRVDDNGDDERGGRLAVAHVPFMFAGMMTGVLLGDSFIWWLLSMYGLTMFY